jgi:hypothetical protein
VLLDHITLGCSGTQGEDERKALDYLSNRLEMMVKELNFGLIFVSHVNDLGQTRGSRNISKIADIRIDLSRDLTAIDNTKRNTTKLVVSKNRFCGKTGPAGKLLFDPLTYKLTELKDEVPYVFDSPSLVPDLGSSTAEVQSECGGASNWDSLQGYESGCPEAGQEPDSGLDQVLAGARG